MRRGRCRHWNPEPKPTKKTNERRTHHHRGVFSFAVIPRPTPAIRRCRLFGETDIEDVRGLTHRDSHCDIVSPGWRCR